MPLSGVLLMKGLWYPSNANSMLLLISVLCLGKISVSCIMSGFWSNTGFPSPTRLFKSFVHPVCLKVGQHLNKVSLGFVWFSDQFIFCFYVNLFVNIYKISLFKSQCFCV